MGATATVSQAVATEPGPKAQRKAGANAAPEPTPAPRVTPRDDGTSSAAAKLMGVFSNPVSPEPNALASTDALMESAQLTAPDATADDECDTKVLRMVEDPMSPEPEAPALEISGFKKLSEDSLPEVVLPPRSNAAARIGRSGSDDSHNCIVVNIKEYVLKELTALHQDGWVTQSPTITADENGENFQAVCVCDKDSIDVVMARLANCGVGNTVGSINVLSLDVSVFSKASTDLLKEGQPMRAGITDDKKCLAAADDSSYDEEGEEQKKLFRETASQLRVQQVVEQITVSSTLTFDYLSLLIIASTIAGVGLAVNSTVSIVASMLVSPIMGPVLALTFGSVINNRKLMKLGLKVELFSLFMCMIVGFIIGLISIAWGTDNLWPTPEMTSRGLYYGLLVGLAIAVPSGMGVALSVLGENTSSLVGVAISASLLPPAVNCGMAFAYAAIGFSVDTNIRDDDTRAFTNAYEYVNLGGISLALTIVNIAAIFASGLIMFRLKDVNPAKHKIAFWQVRGEEIKAYRKHNSAQIGINLETLNGDDNNILKAASANKMLRKELLGIYKHSSIDTTNEEVLNSRNTIRPNRGNRSSEHRPEGSVKNMFNDMENQMKSPAGVNGFLTSHRSV